MSDIETNLRNEANGLPGSFEFRGESFTIPTEYADYPLSYIEAAVDDIPVPLAFSDKLYELRQHIEIVRRRLTGVGHAVARAGVQ